MKEKLKFIQKTKKKINFFFDMLLDARTEVHFYKGLKNIGAKVKFKAIARYATKELIKLGVDKSQIIEIDFYAECKAKKLKRKKYTAQKAVAKRAARN